MADTTDSLFGIARWKPADTQEEQRELLERRVSLFAKLMFGCYCLLMLFVLGLYEVYPETKPERADVINSVAFGGLALMAVMWFVAVHRRDSSIATLRFIETFFAVVIGVIFGLSAFLCAEKTANAYSSFIWCAFMVFGRVLVIPSSGRRTFWLSSGAMSPLVLAVVGINWFHPGVVGVPGPALLIGVVMFCLVTVILATTGSRVLYGLRKQVREAMRLGQYTLGEKIGEGGMGAVYKASHAMLRRPTAIKLLRPGRNVAEDLARFEREVQLTSELTHPNTVAIFDYGRNPDGVFYYAMEYLGGTDLESLVRDHGPQPANRVADILSQVCGALDEAHCRDFIHRDIKPANILLSQRGRIPDVAKVVDFGLVKEIGDEGVSGSNIVAGTPAYLSPEAVTHPDKVGPASDLYALGAVAYFLLTGKTVFSGATAVDVCLNHVEAAPTPPSERTSNRIPNELEEIIMQCLEKDPERRPESALALQEALAKVPRNDDWGRDIARVWWSEFEAAQTEDSSAPQTIVSSSATVMVDLRDRGARDAEVDLDGELR